MYKIPTEVKREAKLGLKLHENGFAGGTTTGWNRAKQLSTSDKIDAKTVRIMKAWFARHGPKAKNGGTSYPGYRKWVSHGRPTKITPGTKNIYRGAVAWLIWGGDAAFDWIGKINL